MKVAPVFGCALLVGMLAGAAENRPDFVLPDPPLVQVLVPGFTARELPLKLNNINNLAFSPDGRLFALGYDGNVHQLKDTDGDGLEDTATYFYKNDRNEIPPSIGMAWGPGGLYIPSQKRVLRLRDRHDGSAELETVTGGWVGTSTKVGANLDAVGIAIDGNGDIFFGLGCDKWNEPYIVDEQTGVSRYKRDSERGTILKVSRDWKKRTPIVTGLRFTIGMAFNAEGDLFCTEQEGATWLANGNPFDELLHIQTGRHYGFPPMHPKYLPKVIDEPSVFDYTPQHQSTCGLHFNEPATERGPIFGPGWWRGDAIVAGESRGKIWRTRLAKTKAGYVAQTELIACLQMLALDAVPTPKGELVVACHSGKPDWGTGPQGEGKLFKLSYNDRSAPQPVFAHAFSPTETRVVFDRPLDPVQFKNLSRRSSITMGKYVAAGDRFESLRPGYQVVKDQLDLPRRPVPVLYAALTHDYQSIVLQTAPRTEALNYAITVPRPNAPAKPDPSSNSAGGDLCAHEETDVLMDLTGVEAIFTPANDKPKRTAWLPHPDFVVARKFTEPSEEHRRFFELLKSPGKLNLRFQLDLSLMLHPAIQPGAKIDYEYPQETVTVVLRSNQKLEVKSSGQVKRVGERESSITVQPVSDKWLPVEISLAVGKKDPVLDVSWFTAADKRERPLPRRRILMPWANPSGSETVAGASRALPELAGGDWQRGKKVFFGERATCFKCHATAGEGGKIGPELASLLQRDLASVLKDINEPSAAINPDHLAYNVDLKGREPMFGVLLDSTDQAVVLGQVTGESTTIPRNNISSMKASAISLMPEGLLKNLSAQEQKDLLTFLLKPEPNASQ